MASRIEIAVTLLLAIAMIYVCDRINADEALIRKLADQRELAAYVIGEAELVCTDSNSGLGKALELYVRRSGEIWKDMDPQDVLPRCEIIAEGESSDSENAAQCDR